MRRVVIILSLVATLVAGCGASPSSGPVPDPPQPTNTEEVLALLSSGPATVLNVWASWCLPCRSEAPLIAAASTGAPGVRFIALNVRDDQSDAQRFMAQYLGEAELVFLSDRSGTVPVALGGTRGVPITFFFARGGDLVHTHLGAIDEPTMAQYLDEISR
jgi:cytochrome c biogenesis protein CcmG, thiol:disulfide interchange protein DsbE